MSQACTVLKYQGITLSTFEHLPLFHSDVCLYFFSDTNRKLILFGKLSLGQAIHNNKVFMIASDVTDGRVKKWP